MAFIQYLKFDEQDLPLPDSYDLDISDVEADSVTGYKAVTRSHLPLMTLLIRSRYFGGNDPLT